MHAQVFVELIGLISSESPEILHFVLELEFALLAQLALVVKDFVGLRFGDVFHEVVVVYQNVMRKPSLGLWLL